VTSTTSTVEAVTTLHVPDQLSPAIVRPREHVQAVLTQTLAETGPDGRAALAWDWALTGARPSPVRLTLAPGRPPSRDDILAEAQSEPEGSRAPADVPTDFRDQLRETRAILTWLVGATDEIPVDDDNRGRFIGARDDYARTDDEIRQVRDNALVGLKARDLCDPIAPKQARHPWRWDAAWMNAAWLRGVRDLLIWVLGERDTSPLCDRAIGTPTTYDLTYEEDAAKQIVLQGRPSGVSADPVAYPPPQYGEGAQAAISWLRGETTSSPVSPNGNSPYAINR